MALLMHEPIPAPLFSQIANTIRFLSADGVQQAKSGHPGLPMGCAEIAALLLGRVLNIDPDDPRWVNRDRFVLSAGHGSMLLYSMLHLAGMLPMDELKRFRQIHSKTPGHPEYTETPGVDMTAGPLGAGFSSAVGMALAERMLADTYNSPKFDVVDHYTYVLMGDGCHMEGLTNEAASFAGHHKIGRLVAFYDDNQISIEGSTSLAFTEDVGARYEALGWQVLRADGHSQDELSAALDDAHADSQRPSLIIAKTVIGRGAPHKQGTAHAHGEPLGDDELAAAKQEMDWSPEKFYVPAEVTYFFEERRKLWAGVRSEWNSLWAGFEKKHKTTARELQRVLSGALPKQWKQATPDYPAGKAVATRSAGGEVMNAFGEVIPELAGGSADLTPSTKTEIKTGIYPDYLKPANFLGRNIHFGVREHAMGGILNGMALHGGFIPFGSTFMVFHDYMRPTVRLAALMELGTIFVYTHDSIYVGEDGPTHQPVEHLAILRAVPGLDVWRPADANETAYAWQAMIERRNGPSTIALTRQNLPVYDREQFAPAKETLKGGYILWDHGPENGKILFIATGSEVALAMEIAEALAAEGRGVRVVSMPCVEVFNRQAEGYRKKVLPRRFRRRVVLEAGIKQGWEGVIGEGGIFVGMETFGISGPAAEVGKHFGFTKDKVIERIAAAKWLTADTAEAAEAIEDDDPAADAPPITEPGA